MTCLIVWNKKHHVSRRIIEKMLDGLARNAALLEKFLMRSKKIGNFKTDIDGNNRNSIAGSDFRKFDVRCKDDINCTI